MAKSKSNKSKDIIHAKAVPIKTEKSRAESVTEITDELLGQVVLTEFDPIEETLSQNPSVKTNPFFPVRVNQSISTTNAVSGLFQRLGSPTIAQDVETKANGKAANAKIIVDTANIVIDGDFSEFDRAVLEAVLSQLAAGNRMMTPAMIFRTMSGKDVGVDVSPDMVAAVDHSISKCMYTAAILPIFDQKGKIIQTLDGQILSVVRSKQNVSGQKVLTYEVQSLPPIYQFCRAINAVTYSPIQMLSAPMTYTRRSLAIMNALQRAVAPFVWNAAGTCMQCADGKSGYQPPPITISYDDIYELASAQDKEDPSEQEDNGKSKYTWYLISKSRETVSRILDYWITQNYIKSWKNTSRGRKIISVSIELYPIDESFLPLPDSVSTSKLLQQAMTGNEESF